MRRNSWRTHARKLVAGAIGLITLLAPMASAPASASIERPGSRTPGYSFRLADGGTLTVNLPGTAPGGTRPPWLPCGLRDSGAKVIKTYARTRTRTPDEVDFPSGPARLRCGNSDFGYRHIVLRHRTEWLTNAALSEDNWLDLADFSINAALTDPDRVVYDWRNNATCFSRAIYLINNRTKQRAGTLVPNVVVGFTTLNVVTAIPKKQQCG